MYRFLLRPKWLAFHLVVVLGVVAMVNLGFWQLRRLDHRRELNATVEQRFDVPAAPLDDVLAQGSPDEIEWRIATASGTYLREEELTLVNRSQDGLAGYDVVTPMRLDDGRILVVNRGFLPLAADAPAAPTGDVRIQGRVRPTQERRTGQLSDPSEGDLTEIQRIDLERLAPQLPGDVVDVYVDLLASDPPEAPGVAPVAAPALGEGPHLSYAVQWFIFAVCVVIGWVLAVRASVRRRHVELRAAARAAAAADPPARAADEPATARSGTPTT